MARGGGELAELAGAIGEGLRAAGAAPPQLHALAREMAHQGLTAELARAVFAEARAKRPKPARIDGYLFLLGEAVDELRLRGNGGSTTAKRELDAVMALLEAQGAALNNEDTADPGMLMALARTLTFAGVAPPPALQAAMAASVGAARGFYSDANPRDMQAELDKLALGMGGNPFHIHAELAALAAAFPVEQRLGLISGLGRSTAAPVRAAGQGFALDPQEPCAMAALEAALQAAQHFAADAYMLARLVRMRPWLPLARRAAADQLITQLRRKAQEPVAQAQGVVKKWFATPADGAGAQSLFALIKDGKMWAAASVLIKHDQGVCDAWVADAMSKREADALAARLIEEADAVEASGDFFLLRTGDALAVNAGTAPPPFALVQVLEAIGAGPLPPRAISLTGLCETLLAGLPADQTGPEALANAHAGAPRWGGRLSTVDTWFEADEQVETLLSSIRGRKKRIAAVLSELLPQRRTFWAGAVAWTAAALHAKAELNPPHRPLWKDMALVAREIAHDAPFSGMPLMRQIAEDTVRVFEGRDF